MINLEKEKIGIIYIIRNTINNKVYIGQSREPIKIRFSKHRWDAKNGCHYAIHKAMRKYGIENFYVELITYCPYSLLDEIETLWISIYQSNKNKFGYNMTPGGASRQSEPYNKSKITEEDILREFIDNKISAFKIAKKYHTTVERVTRILKYNNITYGIDKQRTNSSIEKEILDLYIKGYSSLSICRYFNINKTTVLHILERNNIKRRTFKETKELGRNLPKLI